MQWQWPRWAARRELTRAGHVQAGSVWGLQPRRNHSLGDAHVGWLAGQAPAQTELRACLCGISSPGPWAPRTHGRGGDSFPGAALTTHELGALERTAGRSLPALEARGPKSGCGQGCVPSDSREETCLACPASGGCLGPWRSLVCGHMAPNSASIFTWPSSLCVSVTRASPTDTRHWPPAQPAPVGPHLKLIASAKTLFLNKVPPAAGGEPHASYARPIKPYKPR